MSNMKKKDIDIGFVILNYNTPKETIACITSIEKKIDTEHFIIVVVDNKSKDDSISILSQKYGTSDNIHIIVNEDNVGFASGNNVGFRYIKEKYSSKFICVMNSDTYLIQNDFFQSALLDYTRFHYFVLGPNIETPNQVQSNPLGKHVISFKETKKKILSLKIQLFLNLIGLDKIIRNFIKHNQQDTNSHKRDEYDFNCKLHGCCLILSQDFISNYNGFDEGTFLYLEEDFLYTHMMMDNRLTLYSPYVKIYHCEDASTNQIAKGREKRRFVLKNHLQSMKVINQYLKEEK